MNGFVFRPGVVFCYTRAEALADGVLVDVTREAREAGFTLPVAITEALWRDINTVPERVRWQDPRGRLHDVLWMSGLAAGRAGRNPKTNREAVLPVRLVLHTHNNPHGNHVVELALHCGPGDAGEPVLTIGYPEDL